LLMWMGLFDMFCRFHFLKVTKEVESLIVASLVTCLPRLFCCLGGLGRRECYTSLECVGVACSEMISLKELHNSIEGFINNRG